MTSLLILALLSLTEQKDTGWETRSDSNGESVFPTGLLGSTFSVLGGNENFDFCGHQR